MPLEPGHCKSYNTPTDSFWCCTGTGMENHAKYGDSIYFHDDDALYVNLFIASEVKWPEYNLVVRQDTKFPEEDTTRFTMHCDDPLQGSLKIRHPPWATSLSITVNGLKQEAPSTPGSYADIWREWKDGDRVEVRFPMTLHTEALPGNPNTVALLYGPVVLAGELGAKGLPNLYVHNQTELDHVPSPDVPVFVGEVKTVADHVKPVPGQPLTFRTEGLGQPQDVTLIPFYRMHHQRYSVYWQVLSEAAWKSKQAEHAAREAQRRAYEARTVDQVNPGEQQPETDHKLAGAQTRTGEFRGRKWRDTANGGWFSYNVKVQPDQPMTLVCTYWGSDGGAREFDVLVDGEKIATQKLQNNKPGEFYDETYRVPEKLTHGKKSVTVKFQARPRQMAGGLFGLRVLKP